MEVPSLIALQKEFGPDSQENPGFSVIALALDRGNEGMTQVRSFVIKNGINYPMIMDTKKIYSSFGVSQIPVSYLIDRNGELVKKYVFADYPEFAADVKKLLN